MKILQVIDSLPETSGGARFIVNLCKGLKRIDCNVTLLVINKFESHFLKAIEAEGVRILYIGENISRYNPNNVLKIARILEDFEVIHVHIFPSSYLVALASIFVRKKPVIVFTEHNSYNRRADNRVFKFIEKLVYSRFDKVVCLSEQVYDFVVEKLNINEEKLCIIQNAIDIDEVLKVSGYKKSELGFSDSDFLLLMSARLSTQKNHDILIRSMQYLSNDVKLLLAGDGDLKSKLIELVKDLSLENRVFFLGSRSDIFSLLKSVDVNILSSNFEGLSLAALESMAVGKPFIASKVEGLDFVVNNEKLLFDNQEESIVESINKLKDDINWYKEASLLTKQRAFDFDFKEMTNRYLKVYEELYKV